MQPYNSGKYRKKKKSKFVVVNILNWAQRQQKSYKSIFLQNGH